MKNTRNAFNIYASCYSRIFLYYHTVYIFQFDILYKYIYIWYQCDSRYIRVFDGDFEMSSYSFFFLNMLSSRLTLKMNRENVLMFHIYIYIERLIYGRTKYFIFFELVFLLSSKVIGFYNIESSKQLYYNIIVIN